MFGISGEHLLILAGILLIFGPRKLPELGSSIGKALKNFKEGMNNNPEPVGRVEVRDPDPEVESTATTKDKEEVVEPVAAKDAPKSEPTASV